MSTLPARGQPAAAPAAAPLLDCAVCGLQGPPKELADCAGSHFDPACVDSFVRALSKLSRVDRDPPPVEQAAA